MTRPLGWADTCRAPHRQTAIQEGPTPSCLRHSFLTRVLMRLLKFHWLMMRGICLKWSPPRQPMSTPFPAALDRGRSAKGKVAACTSRPPPGLRTVTCTLG